MLHNSIRCHLKDTPTGNSPHPICQVTLPSSLHHPTSHTHLTPMDNSEVTHSSPLNQVLILSKDLIYLGNNHQLVYNQHLKILLHNLPNQLPNPNPVLMLPQLPKRHNSHPLNNQRSPNNLSNPTNPNNLYKQLQ